MENKPPIVYDNGRKLVNYAKYPFESVETMMDAFQFSSVPLTPESMEFRMNLLKEEYQETEGAYRVNNHEEWVDGHIDIIVVALGNLALAKVNIDKAFNQVMNANMSKEIGTGKKSYDVPGMSIIKPEGWIGPDHSNNHGILEKAMKTQGIIDEIDKILSED